MEFGHEKQLSSEGHVACRAGINSDPDFDFDFDLDTDRTDRQRSSGGDAWMSAPFRTTSGYRLLQRLLLPLGLSLGA